MEKISWFKKRKITAGFAIATFLIGFAIIDNRSISGNVILNDAPVFEPISLIGLFLIFCVAILTIYTLRKR